MLEPVSLRGSHPRVRHQEHLEPVSLCDAIHLVLHRTSIGVDEDTGFHDADPTFQPFGVQAAVETGLERVANRLHSKTMEDALEHEGVLTYLEIHMTQKQADHRRERLRAMIEELVQSEEEKGPELDATA